MGDTQIVIVDYGMGNIQSVHNAFEHLGCRVVTSDKREAIFEASAIVLPGVGAFGEAVANLKQRDLIAPIREAVINRGIPLMGICLGMQLLAEESEERGRHRGLGLIPGFVRTIPVPDGYRLPHIGWNTIRIGIVEPLFCNLNDGDAFYFVHSFHFECESRFISAVTSYGCEVVAAVQTGRICATQFHPERSHSTGLRLIKNFIDWVEKIRQ